MMNIKFNCHLTSVHSLFCLKAPAVKDTENAKKEEGQGGTSASPSRHKMPGTCAPAWLNKPVRKASSPKKEPDFHFQWEEGSLLVSPERGKARLQNLRLDKQNFAKGREGEISRTTRRETCRIEPAVRRSPGWPTAAGQKAFPLRLAARRGA